MTNEQIITIGDPAGVFLSEEILHQIGVDVGDQVVVSVLDRTLIVRSLDEAERRQKMDAAMKELMENRQEVYECLAEGVQ